MYSVSSWKFLKYIFLISKLTKTCQTFSFAPSKEQNLMLTPTKAQKMHKVGMFIRSNIMVYVQTIHSPRSPWPPHKLLGVILASVQKKSFNMKFTYE